VLHKGMVILLHGSIFAHRPRLFLSVPICLVSFRVCAGAFVFPSACLDSFVYKSTSLHIRLSA